MRIKSLFVIVLLFLAITAYSVSGQSGGATPDANWRILFASDLPGVSTDLYLIDPEGISYQRLTDLTIQFQARYPDGADCSPDGFSVVFAAGELYKMNADGSNPTELLPLSNGLHREPRWSPDGTQLVFNAIGYGSVNNEIFVANADGSNVTRLTNNDYTDRYPSWSPDGTQIAFSYEDEGYTGIAVIDADGTNLIQLTHTTMRDIEPAWSPDGQSVVFSSNRDGLYNLYTIQPDGSNLTQIISNSGNNRYPKWSPDGNLISFSSDRDNGKFQVYVIDADGSNPRRVTNEPFSDVDNFNMCWLAMPVSPTASAGPDQNLTDTDSSGSELVTLDGTGSSDPDGTIVGYSWTENEVEIATGATPTVELGVGVHTITLTVTDDDGLTASDEVVVAVEAGS